MRLVLHRELIKSNYIREQAKKTWRAHHKEKGIVTQAWSPLGSGGNVLNDPTIIVLSEKYQKNPEQIILRWIHQLEVVAIPRSKNLQRQKSNLEIFNFHLTMEQWRKWKTLPTSKYSLTGEVLTLMNLRNFSNI